MVAHALGASVTGSDRVAGSPYAATLKAAGIEPIIGHDAANVPEGAEVVYSSAIPHCAANKACNRGDSECAIGWPKTVKRCIVEFI